MWSILTKCGTTTPLKKQEPFNYITKVRITSALLPRPRSSNVSTPGFRHLKRIKKLQKGKIIPEIHDYVTARLMGKPQTKAIKQMYWFKKKHKNYAPLFVGQLRPQVKLVATALVEKDLPPPTLPEIALIGRSNVGKSSLINGLCGREHTAKVSRRPGTTQELHFYDLGKPACLRLVDLPGFGEADAKEEKRLQWTEFSLYYLKTRKQLKRVLILIDAYYGLHSSDRDLIAYLDRARVMWQIIVSKADTLKAKLLAKRLYLVREEVSHFGHCAGPIIPVSVQLLQGLNDLRKALEVLQINPDKIKQENRDKMKSKADQIQKEKVKRREEKRANKKAEVEAEEKARQESVQNALQMWGITSTNSKFNTPPSISNPSMNIPIRVVYDPIWNLIQAEVFPQVVAEQNTSNFTPTFKRILDFITTETTQNKPLETETFPIPLSHALSQSKIISSDIFNDSRVSAVSDIGIEFDMRKEPSELMTEETDTILKSNNKKLSEIDNTDDMKAYLKKRYHIDKIEDPNEAVVRLSEPSVVKNESQAKRASCRNEKAPEPSEYDGRYEADLKSTYYGDQFTLEPLHAFQNYNVERKVLSKPMLPRKKAQEANAAREASKGVLQRPKYIGLHNAPRIPPRGRGRSKLLGQSKNKILPQRPPQDIANFFGLHEVIRKRRKELDWNSAKQKWKQWAIKHPKAAKEVENPKKEGVLENYMDAIQKRVDKVTMRINQFKNENPGILERTSLPQKMSAKRLMKQKGPQRQDKNHEGELQDLIQWNYYGGKRKN